MLLLAGANDKYELTTSAVGDIDITAHFMDASTADPPVVKGSTSTPQLTTITTATTTTIVTAPGASVIRSISALTIRNADATVAQDVTVILDRSATDYEVWKTNLLPGDVLAYEDGLGWFKTAFADPLVQYIRKVSDTTNGTTSLADAGGLGFSIAANATYEIEWNLIWTTNTVTVGIGFAVNGPAGFTSLQGTIMLIGGIVTSGITDIGGAGFTAYEVVALTTSAVATSTNYPARISCLVENGATAGTITPRHKSETGTTTTVKAGSFGTCRRLG